MKAIPSTERLREKHLTKRQETTTPEWADEKFVTAMFGITHTPLFNLRKSRAIRSLSLRAEGATYGKRLYHIPSLVAFLAALEVRELKGKGPPNETANPKGKAPAAYQGRKRGTDLYTLIS